GGQGAKAREKKEGARGDPRKRSEPTKRRARERVGEFRLRQGYGGHRRSFSGGVPKGKAPRIRLEAVARADSDLKSTDRERIGGALEIDRAPRVAENPADAHLLGEQVGHVNTEIHSTCCLADVFLRQSGHSGTGLRERQRVGEFLLD